MYREMRDRSCGRARWLSRMLASCAYPTPVLLALFLIDLAAGLVVFLPLVGRRNAGVKFYRLGVAVSGAVALWAIAAPAIAKRKNPTAKEVPVILFSLWGVLSLVGP